MTSIVRTVQFSFAHVHLFIASDLKSEGQQITTVIVETNTKEICYEFFIYCGYKKKTYKKNLAIKNSDSIAFIQEQFGGKRSDLNIH